MSFRPAFLSASAAVLGCLLLAPAALAAGGESTPLNLGSGAAAHSAPAATGGGGMVRTIVGLAIVLAVIFGLHWTLKQVKASKEERATGGGLSALATLPLGPNRSLALVRAGSEVVLVGVGEAGVTPIRTYAEAEARSLGLLAPEPGEAPFALDGLGAVASLATVAPSTARTPVGRWVEALRRRTVIR
jgi:flagellar protein FliO/FliZ